MSVLKSVVTLSLVLFSSSGERAFASFVLSSRDSIVFRPDVERMFNEGLKRFEARDYEGAADLFGQIARQYPSSHRVTAAYIMGAKALFQFGEFRESIRYLDALRERFPESRYIDDAHYTLGLNYLRLGRFVDSASEFVEVLETSPQTELRERAESMLDFVAVSRLEVNQIRAVVNTAHRKETTTLLNVYLAEKVATTGNVHEAIQILQPFASLAGSDPAVRKAQSLLKRLGQGGALKIGVLVPLMQESGQPGAGELGRDLLEGIKFAVERHNAEHLPKVSLVVRDTERDASVAARQMTDLSQQDDIAAILGPVFSNQVFASAGIANARGIPIITPTATSNGIAAIGPYVFQANPDYDIRGRAMAQLAVEQLHAKRLAIVAPVDAVGKLMAESFAGEARRLGVEFFAIQWYESGATDLRTQLAALREQALKLTEPMMVNFSAKMKNTELAKLLQGGVPQKRLDSLVDRGASVSVEFLFGGDGKRIADSLKLPVQRVPIRYDSLGIPVQNIDAVFLPIASPDEIGIVTSQLRYFNFQTQLLGTGDWQDLPELDRNRQYADGVIFSTDYYPDMDDEEYRSFTLGYQGFANKAPSKSSVLGYDAMGMLLDVIRRGAASRTEIANGLSRVTSYAGLHSRISFSDARVNSNLILLQFKNRSVVRLGEIDVAHRRLTE